MSGVGDLELQPWNLSVRSPIRPVLETAIFAIYKLSEICWPTSPLNSMQSSMKCRIYAYKLLIYSDSDMVGYALCTPLAAKYMEHHIIEKYLLEKLDP